jgi:hypothetical protein
MLLDYTTFTEVDPSSAVTITPTAITVTAQPATADSHVSKQVAPVADYSLSAKAVVSTLEDKALLLGFGQDGQSVADLAIDTDAIVIDTTRFWIYGHDITAMVLYDTGATPLTFHLRMIRRGTNCYHKIDQLVDGEWVNKIEYKIGDQGTGPATRDTIIAYGSTDDGGATSNTLTLSELRWNNIAPGMPVPLQSDMQATAFWLTPASAQHVASGHQFIVQADHTIFVGNDEAEAASQRFAIPGNTPTRVKANGRLWLWARRTSGGYVRKEK